MAVDKYTYTSKPSKNNLIIPKRYVECFLCFVLGVQVTVIAVFAKLLGWV